MTKCGLKACLVSVSGGVDSAVTYALMCEAAKLPGSPIKKVLGIAQPIHRFVFGLFSDGLEFSHIFKALRPCGSVHSSCRSMVVRSSLSIRPSCTISFPLRSRPRSPMVSRIVYSPMASCDRTCALRSSSVALSPLVLGSFVLTQNV